MRGSQGWAMRRALGWAMQRALVPDQQRYWLLAQQRVQPHQQAQGQRFYRCRPLWALWRCQN
jgi:hypothetical protein